MAEKDKNEDEYKDNLDNSSSQDDEDFGLPDLDDDNSEETVDEVNSTDDEVFELPTENDLSEETVTFDTEETIVTEEIVSEDYDEDEFQEEEDSEPVATYTAPKQSSAPIIITLSIIVIIACIAVYFLFIRDSKPSKEIVEVPVKDTTTYVVEKPMEVEEPIEETVVEEKVAVINTLNVRSGRSYVVVGSFFDDDLAMDYAKELKKKGTSSYIIPPFGKSKFTRVAVEETTSFADASTIASELSGQYKEQPWPLKY